MTEEEQAGTVPGGALTGSMPETPIVPPAPPANIDLSPSPDPTTPPSSVPRPRGYILDQLHSRDVAEAMLINALIKAGWPRDRAPDRAVALMTRDATAKDRFAESDWKGFERTIDESLGNLRMSPRQWREIRMMLNGWRGAPDSGVHPATSTAQLSNDQAGSTPIAPRGPGAAGAVLLAGMAAKEPPQSERPNPTGPTEKNQPSPPAKKSAVITDTSDGPYLLIDPQLKDVLLIEAPTAHRISSESEKKAFGLYLPPSAAEVGSLDEGLTTDKARGTMSRQGQPLVIRYPNGELHVARNPKTGEILKVGGDKMHVMEAAKAEQSGLGEWMPFTQPKAMLGPIIPDFPDAPIGADKRKRLIAVIKSIAKTGAENMDSILNYLAEDRARELYTPRAAAPNTPDHPR